MTDLLTGILHKNRQGQPLGIYSVCSANGFVLEAAMKQALADGSLLLVESTSNQVDQFGGYTGMTPAGFVTYMAGLAQSAGFPVEKLVLGGDHLGPNAWQHLPAAEAMQNARTLIRDYVKAGFRKIHLDTSMRCADDPGNEHTPLDPEVAAERAADLCREAEQVCADFRPQDKPVYVIGTEVPIPGGAQETLDSLTPTTPVNAAHTIGVTKAAFASRGLDRAWERVIALVVQPGVEFGDDQVVDYHREGARPLCAFIEKVDHLVYEAHSTDYQTEENLQKLVADHFAILKVGPWLTFALREALFALAKMEDIYVGGCHGAPVSRLKAVLEKAMLDQPGYWQKHYQGGSRACAFKRFYSYSDRIRYYWPNGDVQKAVALLLSNLETYSLPMTLVSQYMPAQYEAVRDGRITRHPLELLRDKIMEVTGIYARATGSCPQ
ncbi:MAG: D-tagatose-bisphosphate aldolase, class II, non-catalytic subunit [Calditrichaeota bacterium]|nr:D-tagatose-bisphosphate aldolase, class II, non-catalytic subunit [Calditrichota bacterium]HQU74047.1 D-tagatose-bisphosphate aldolase, class II, non-catalytic subunit [Calditrichia bacterium]